jgi:hypothetical protein
MTYRYVFDDHQPFVYVYVSGEDSYADHIDRIRKITSDPRWEIGHSVLVDFSGTTEFEITNEELQKIADEQRLHDEKIGHGKIAVVAPADMVFGLTRMWEAYVETETSMKTMVFAIAKPLCSGLALPARMILNLFIRFLTRLASSRICLSL